MINLLSMGYTRLFKSLAFRISTVIMAVLPVIAVLFNYFDSKAEKVPQDGVYNIGLYLIWLLIGSFVSMFVGQDYDEKTIGNKIMAGHSRASVYLTDYIVTLSGAVLMHTAAFITATALSVPLFGMYTEPLGDILLSQTVVLGIIAVYTAVVLFITTLVTSKLYAQGVSMAAVLALFITGNSVYDKVTKLRIKAEKEDIAVTELVEKNSMTDILYNAIPQSQADIIMEGGVPENAAKMFCIDISAMTVITAAGLLVFGRKDIK